MQFDPNGPLDMNALAKAHDFMLTLPDTTAPDCIRRLYGHWPGGGLCDHDAAYNLSTVFDGSTWQMEITHTPLANARRIAEGDDYAAHTLGRNSFALGCAIDGMGGPDSQIQEHELEVFLAMVAAAAFKYGIDLSGSIKGPHGLDEPTFMTHAEAAIADAYWPDRVDLGALPPDNDYTRQKAAQTASFLRIKAHRYKITLGG